VQHAAGSKVTLRKNPSLIFGENLMVYTPTCNVGFGLSGSISDIATRPNGCRGMQPALSIQTMV